MSSSKKEQTNQILECDVLIVGGGPAGLSVASHLGDNISSIVVHQDAEIGKPVRTSGGTWIKDMQELGIPEKFYQIIHQLDFYSDHEQALFEVKDDKMAVLDITALYQYLASLSDTKNRKLMLGSKFTDAIQQPDGRYSATIRSRQEGDTTIICEYIIDASGWHCAVLESLGLNTRPSRQAVGIEYEFPLADFNSHRAILFVGSSALTGYGWIFPTPYQTLRLGVGVIHPDTALSPRQVMNAFIESGQAAKYGLTIPPNYEVNAGIIPSVAYEDKLVYGKVIRTGDSANFASPTVGEGIRMAIKFGRLLGKELSKQMGGDSKSLTRYEKVCTKEFQRDYKFGFMVNQRIAQYTPERWDKSVRRLSRLSEREMTRLVRSRFDFTTITRTIWLSLLAKIRGS